MGQSTWTGAQLGHSLSGCRVAGDDLLLAFAEHVPDEYTLGLWHMNEASWTVGQADCLDSSGNGNHLTVVGTGCNTAADQWMDRGADFTAAGRYVRKTAFAPTSGPYTIEVWAWWNGTVAGGYRTMFGTGKYGGSGPYVELDQNTARLIFVVNTNINQIGRTMPSQAWTHYAITCDGGTYLKLWENGTLIKTVSRTTNLHGADLAFGSTGALGGTFTQGYQDESRLSNVERYTAAFSPIRYPASGTGTADPATAVACAPGLLTVTLAEALPAGTSLKAKLLSTGGGDTGFQTLAGTGTSYSYDFTGAAAGTWYPAVQLFAGGSMNANTPTVTQAVLDWTAVYPRRGGGFARFGPSLVRWCL